MDKSYDQKLRDAISEIEVILKKYDCAGFVSLASKTHGEFSLFLEHMSWSKLKFTKDSKMRLLELHAKSNKVDTDSTLHCIYSIRDLCGMTFMKLDDLTKQIEKHTKVEHESLQGRITNDDR